MTWCYYLILLILGAGVGFAFGHASGVRKHRPPLSFYETTQVTYGGVPLYPSSARDVCYRETTFTNGGLSVRIGQ